jgi:hypothetical protein
MTESGNPDVDALYQAASQLSASQLNLLVTKLTQLEHLHAYLEWADTDEDESGNDAEMLANENALG